jgi:predicted acylesterase/phospholipase RssA
MHPTINNNDERSPQTNINFYSGELKSSEGADMAFSEKRCTGASFDGKAIKHIVLSGGGVMCLTQYGILYESMKTGFWKLENIQTVYGASAGSIIMTVILFAKLLDWNIIDDYVKKRPWKQVFGFNIDVIAQSFHKKGMFDKKVIEDIYKPLLAAIDKDVNITLKEFYDVVGVESHFISAELTKFEMVDLSYKTHPNWKLVDAVYCSGCLPFLFSPYYHENKIYMDGSLFMHFPIKACVDNGANRDEIFGITNIFDETNVPTLNSLYDYILYIIDNLLNHILVKNPPVKYCVYIPSTYVVSIYDIYLMANSSEYLLKLTNKGVNIWKCYNAKMQIHHEIINRKHVEETFTTSEINSNKIDGLLSISEYPLGY